MTVLAFSVSHVEPTRDRVTLVCVLSLFDRSTMSLEVVSQFMKTDNGMNDGLIKSVQRLSELINKLAGPSLCVSSLTGLAEERKQSRASVLKENLAFQAEEREGFSFPFCIFLFLTFQALRQMFRLGHDCALSWPLLCVL